jgi:hypothetical protein
MRVDVEAGRKAALVVALARTQHDAVVTEGNR